ncbi:unnamed protein product [Knipowitschia caucasica]
MTKETETLGLVFQSENFNYNRFPSTMDSWSYMNDPGLDQNLSKPRLQPGDDITAITMLYEQCKNQKEQKVPANRISLLKPTESYSQELQGSKAAVPTTDGNSCLTTVMADTYDKHELNNIFDSLLQRWPEGGAFTDPGPEALRFPDPFPEEQSSPIYSGSYSGSPQEHLRSDFTFSLGAAAASPYRPSQLPMVYLNKGQFYPITLRGADGIAATKVKTVVMAVFENDKTPELQLRFWNHWHARQPTVRQRVIDIADYKDVYSSISNVEEVAFNALSFVWNPSEDAKVYIGINSLSTDFSSQKGVKGQPLNLQIDTYEFSSGTNRLIHRAACQVKIFCDKGAERKMRDEERKRSKRRTKSVDANANKAALGSSAESTLLQTLDDHITVPVLFIPDTHLSSLRVLAAPVDESERGILKRLYPDRGDCSSAPSKLARQEDPRVLLYVRTTAEEVFNALMLNSPTLAGLKEALSEKYSMQVESIGKIFKKCKRGIFVNMDDTIVEHYSNQSAFLIEVSSAEGQMQLTLVEV